MELRRIRDRTVPISSGGGTRKFGPMPGGGGAFAALINYVSADGSK